MASDDDGHPIVWGLVALVVVAVVIGAIFGGAALVGSRVAGLSGSPTGSGASDRPTLYLPTPTPTVRASPGGGASSGPGSAPSSARRSRAPRPIALIAGQARVASFGQIDLSGTYPSGEGAVLAVQRLEDGHWVGFYSVTTVVVGGRFATNVQTSRTGVNVFRMVDTDTQKASNPVRVRVG